MELIKLKLAEIFSKTPGPRYKEEGDFSGEEFRTIFFAPAMKKAIKEDLKITIDLDGTAGYGTSFLEEIFGGLIREDKIPFSEIEKRLEIISNEEEYLKDDIRQDLIDAKNEQGNER